MTTATSAAASGSKTARFGTFGGVFTPNILTILGIILFLRTGWVVGQAGLVGALTIVAIANLISLLTGLSLSAIATSMDVRAGGNYYLISRSLGLEIGGAIGIPLYLSQAISVAFYIIGFTEALLALEFFQAFDPRLIASLVVLLFAVIAYIGADFALKIQYIILAILMAALVSFFAGGWDSIGRVALPAGYTEGITFWMVFAVFFPAVTGIEVGTSLSGDLKDPGRSIPLGTIASILFTAVIYFAVIIWFATHMTTEELINNNLAMQNVALWPQLILAGVWASTLSSALGSVLAAPRTLQAIAQDRVVPRWIAGQMGSPTEPRMAVLITAVIATGIIWLGDLNFVAPIISMFFLNTYGMVNLAASIEKLVDNPSFRPRFNIPWYVSMLGALGCYGAMFLINPLATVVAIVISYGIFFYLERRQLQRTWGDVRSGVWFTIARWALLNLEGHRWGSKNWRPNIIVFTGQPHNRQQLAEMAEWLTLGRGVVTFFQLLVGDISKLAGRGLRETARRHIREYIQDRKMTAFAEAEVVSDFKTGALTVVQAHGLGALEPNAVLMGWSRTPPGRKTLMELLGQLDMLGKSVLFLNYDEQRGFGKRKIIHVWWGGRGGNADMMLLLSHLIARHRSWQGAEVKLLRIIQGEDGRADTKAHMKALLKSVNVQAEPVILVKPNGQSFTDVIRQHSVEADLTLLGLHLPSSEEAEAYSQRLHDMVGEIGSVLMVRSAQRELDLLSGG